MCVTRRVVLIMIMMTLAISLLAQQTDDQLTSTLLASPPPNMAKLAQAWGTPSNPESFHVNFLRADLDGTGRFNFVLAFYVMDTGGEGFLRVFRQNDAN